MAAKTTLRGTTRRGTTLRGTTRVLAAPGDSFAPAVLRLRAPFSASYKVTWAEFEAPAAASGATPKTLSASVAAAIQAPRSANAGVAAAIRLPWLIGFATMQVCMGLTLAMVFQLAHVVEGVHFDDAYESKKIATEWAKHQVMTTANFAMGSKAVSWFVGGLNFQIEHHLFPRVSHVHYPAIAPIVQQVCQEHNVPYTSFPTVAAAFASHYRFMRWLGQRGDAEQALAAA